VRVQAGVRAEEGTASERRASSDSEKKIKAIVVATGRSRHGVLVT